MNIFKMLLFFMMCVVLTQCGTEADPETEPPEPPQFEIDFDTVQVFVVEATEEYILAGTKYGVYRNELTIKDRPWVYIGPKISPDTSRIGDILDTGSELLVVVRNTIEFHDLPDNYTSIYKNTDTEGSWESVTIELEGRGRPYVLNRIARPTNSNTLYGDWHLIFKSTNGETWEDISTEEVIGTSEFLTISKEHPNQIWTGGWMNTLIPYLAKSDDGGETWTNLNNEVYFNMNATANEAVIHPENPQIVLVGFGGSTNGSRVVRKSWDGGQNWQTVLEGYNINTLHNSNQFPGRVYASGTAPQKQLFVAVSDDFGDSWDIQILDENIKGIITNDLAVAAVDGNEVLFLGTTRGVHSITFEE